MKPRGAVLYLATLVFALALIVLDTHWRSQLIRDATDFAKGTGASAQRDEAAGVRPHNLMLPATGIDGLWWVMHTEQMLANHSLRIRHTSLDNAPDGRAVHWSSIPMWILIAIAPAAQFFGPPDGVTSIEWATIFFGSITLATGLLFFSGWIWRRFGAAAAALFLLSTFAATPFFITFRTGETDHHGLVSLAGFASVLFLVSGGCGLRPEVPNERRQRNDFILSGIAGAVGLWISSASQVPVLAGIAGGAFLVALASGRTRPPEYRAELWRLWGISGGIASICFYLIEYCPDFPGLRLEVNNPLFSIAWAAGGEILFRITRALSSRTGWKGLVAGRTEAATLVLSILVVTTPALVVLLGGNREFTVNDRFLYDLHRHYINEFQPILTLLSASGWSLTTSLFVLWPVFCLLAAGAALLFRCGSLKLRLSLLFCVMPALVMQALALKQARWSGNAAILWTCVCIVSFLCCVHRDKERTAGRKLAWALAIPFAVLSLVYPVITCLSWWEITHTARGIAKADLPAILMRDVAQRITASSGPDKRPVVLSGPTTTTSLIYYGGLRGLGTLYWENLDGLEAAAHIYSAQTEEEALELIRQRGVTHLVLFSWESFAQSYVRLTRGLGKEELAKDGYVAGLLEGTRRQPVWLRPLYYPIPKEYQLDDVWARIYEVRPEQTPSEWQFHVGKYQLDAGLPHLALESFTHAYKLDRNNVDAGVSAVLLYISAGKESEARMLGSEVVRDNPKAAEVLTAAGAELSASGREKEGAILKEIAKP